MNNYIKKNKQQKYNTYYIGYFISLILTILPFILVTYTIDKFESKNTIILLLISLAILQTIIHLIFFLDLNPQINEKQKWKFLSLIFTSLIIAILIIGTLWIMKHLNNNLM